jgi:predicted MFS family arabinose efflux permease
LGAVWGGLAVDRFELPALIAGAGLLAVISMAVLAGSRIAVRR